MNESECYIVRCLCGCGALVGACVDNPQHREATVKFVNAAVKDGYKIECMTTAAARALSWGCKKERTAKEQGLFKGGEIMSRWTHNICAECYAKYEPEREPARFIEGSPETCCFCGKENTAGIFYRYDPDKLRCKGEHPGDSEDKASP